MKRKSKLSIAIFSLLTSSTAALSNPSGQYWETLLEQSNTAKLRSELSQFQILPVSGVISSEFGLRIHPISGEQKVHSGIDIAAAEGESFVAVADGKVIEARNAGGYGNLIVIKHRKGLLTRYAHAQKILVTLGQNVRKGEVIGLVGSTGQSTGPHVHFEIARFNQEIDPASYIFARKNMTLEEYSKTLYQPKSKALDVNEEQYVKTQAPVVPSTQTEFQKVKNLNLGTKSSPVEPLQAIASIKPVVAEQKEGSLSLQPRNYSYTSQTMWSLATEIQTDLGHGLIIDIMNLLLDLNPAAFKNNDINFRYAHVPLFIPLMPELSALIPDTVQTAEPIWTLATRLKKNYESDVSIFQIMAALTLKNPEAFTNGNVNLRLSSIPLRLPKEQEILSISHEKAVAQYTRSLNYKKSDFSDIEIAMF